MCKRDRTHGVHLTLQLKLKWHRIATSEAALHDDRRRSQRRTDRVTTADARACGGPEQASNSSMNWLFFKIQPERSAADIAMTEIIAGYRSKRGQFHFARQG